MKIGKATTPSSAICTSDEDTIVVRGRDLCAEVIGKLSFTEYFFLLLTGKAPTKATLKVLDATLVAITEHGLVPSVQAARMTYAASPEALQGAVAAGLLGCGSVILGASANAGEMLDEVKQRMSSGKSLQDSARDVVSEYRAARKPLPGYGHPLHKSRDPRVSALFNTASEAGSDLSYVEIAEEIEKVIPEIVGKPLKLNVSAAIPAVLLGAGFPLQALRGVPILARSAGLVAHLYEEQQSPIGFALSYQATREYEYTGDMPSND
ncbi:citryl-CoA lyase [Marinobacter sp. 71-i]|uniref:citrate synthase (unknown stereospecificity) n=1 Tax=Marinobacter iranensis TaxID=2962607 RepID=A0ABT5YFV5_9GAMM|nr:citryl-CoA lyase [Marinobacter iranensis]MDF0752583.1 citryl-CoA lyase [Marinobacter iranensis]